MFYYGEPNFTNLLCYQLIGLLTTSFIRMSSRDMFVVLDFWVYQHSDIWHLDLYITFYFDRDHVVNEPIYVMITLYKML